MTTVVRERDVLTIFLTSRSARFRILGGVACVIALAVPVLGANPIMAQVATQISQVFILPLAVLILLLLCNNKELMGNQRANWLLNAGMVATLTGP